MASQAGLTTWSRNSYSYPVLRKVAWMIPGLVAFALVLGLWNDAALPLAEAVSFAGGTLAMWVLARLFWPRLYPASPNTRVTGLGGLNWAFLGAAIASMVVVFKSATGTPPLVAVRVDSDEGRASKSSVSEEQLPKPGLPSEPAPWVFQIPRQEVQRDFDSGAAFAMSKIGEGHIGVGASRIEIKAELEFLASTPSWANSPFDYTVALVCDGAKLNEWRFSDVWGPKASTFRRNIEYIGPYQSVGQPPDCQLRFQHIETNWTYRSGLYSNPRDELRLVYSLALKQGGQGGARERPVSGPAQQRVAADGPGGYAPGDRS